jgi:hypothetical protein
MLSQSDTQTITLFEEFLQSFFSLLQTLRIHGDNNKLVVDGVFKFSNNLARSMEGESIAIKASKENLSPSRLPKASYSSKRKNFHTPRDQKT